MAHTWNDAFNESPANSDSPSGGAEAIRDTRTYAFEAIDQEHDLDGNDVESSTVLHKAGSGVAYHQSAAPTTRPDGSTSLDGDDPCRLWIDSDDNSLKFWDGVSAFEEAAAHDVVDQTGGSNIRQKVVSGTTTSGQVSIAHGLTLSKIVGVAPICYHGFVGVDYYSVDSTYLDVTLNATTSDITVKAVIFYTE